MKDLTNSQRLRRLRVRRAGKAIIYTLFTVFLVAIALSNPPVPW